MPSGPLLLDGRLDSRLLVLLFGQRFLDTTTTQKGPLLWGQKRSSMGSSMRNFKQVLQLIFFLSIMIMSMHFNFFFCLIWVPASERYFDNSPIPGPWALPESPSSASTTQPQNRMARPSSPARRRSRSPRRGRASVDSQLPWPRPLGIPGFTSYWLRGGADRKTSIEIQESLGFSSLNVVFSTFF